MKHVTLKISTLAIIGIFSFVSWAQEAPVMEIPKVEVRVDPGARDIEAPADMKGSAAVHSTTAADQANFGGMQIPNMAVPTPTQIKQTKAPNCDSASFCGLLANGVSGNAYGDCMFVEQNAPGALTMGTCNVPSVSMAVAPRANLIKEIRMTVSDVLNSNDPNRGNYDFIRNTAAKNLAAVLSEGANSIRVTAADELAATDQLSERGHCKYENLGAIQSAVNHTVH